mgnify:CR=1 FL=1
MSENSIKEFLEKLTNDESLRNELTNTVKDRDDKETAAAEVAAKHGFEVDAGSLKRILDAAQTGAKEELTEEELDAVAAGLTIFQQILFAPPYVPCGMTPSDPIDQSLQDPEIGGANIP